MVPSAEAQVDGIADPIEAIEDLEVSTQGFREGSVVVAPIPFRNETIGTGLALGGGYVFRFEGSEQSSFFALGAFKTENESLGGGASVFLSLPGDRFRIQGLAGTADLNYKVRVGQRLVDVRQETPILRFGGEVRLWPKLYVGLRLTLLDVKLGTSVGERLLDHIDLYRERSVRITMPELMFSYENVDDDLYPRSGVKASFSASRVQVDGTRNGDFNKAFAKVNHYVPIGERDVIASELTVCKGDRGTPFYLQCSLGGTDSLRGFSPTEFFSPELASLQTEYRGRLSDRWGYVAFAGAGTLDGRLIERDEDVFASGGAGIRFRVSKKFPVDFSIDFARTSLGTSSVTAFVGQSF